MRPTFRNRYSPVLYKWATREEQAQLGADEAAANPYEKHVDELLLLEAFPTRSEATSAPYIWAFVLRVWRDLRQSSIDA